MAIKGASIIVATYNRAYLLKQVLNALLKQKTKYSYEIIVVNDNSKDRTEDVLNQYRNDRRIRIISLKKTMGPAVTRNVGFKAAKYPVAIVMDDDCIAGDNWLNSMMKPFSDKKVGVSSHYYVKVNGEYFYGGTSTAYLAEAVKAAGYFDYRFTALPINFTFREDTDLVLRIKEMGYKVAYAKGANFLHVHKLPTKLRDKVKYLLTRIWIHQADVLLYKKHPDKAKILLGVNAGFFIPPLSDYKKATGLWEGATLSVSSPQGVAFIRGGNLLSTFLVMTIGIAYVFFMKLVRLYGSIRYGKLLL
ncbi:MAG: glycosyltransferase [Candidatus Aenigmarchaeota archaeon]|nr:glycosyltransferase [Candidatus Aenigmarchaeota archaeon]